MDQEEITVRFKDPFVLMHELQQMAENNATLARRWFIPRDTLFAAAAIYQQLYVRFLH